MGKTTIEWTAIYKADGTVTPGYSWNPWWGCVKVSDGCTNCYAETFAKRTGHNIWGPAATTERRTFGDKHWAEPLKWNADAQAAGERRRVFCASMADVFEDHPQLEPERLRLWELIGQTPHLDWLLLTKRPENIRRMYPQAWLLPWRAPENVWLGTSIETQEMAEKRADELLRVPASVRFFSCEPLLGPLDLTKWLDGCGSCGAPRKDSPYVSCGCCEAYPEARGVSWIIAGGESGPTARPMHEDWARSLRDQCQTANIPYFFKQWGQWLPASQRPDNWYNSGDLMFAADKQTVGRFIRLKSKHDAGRLLDGREWNEMPR